MPRMKLKDDEFNVKELDVEVGESKFKRYTGEVPKTGTILICRVTKMWWTQSGDGTSQIFMMAFAEQNEGKLKEFNGLPIREYLTFKPTAAFRYVPAMECLGFTLRDIKAKMIVEDEPDTIGDVITKIGDFVVGSEDALVRLVIKRERYEDEWTAKIDIDGWLPLEDEDEDDEDDEDLDDEDEDEEEDDEPPARPSRGRSAKSPTSRRRRAEPEPDEDDEDIDDEDEDDEEEEAEDEEAEEEAEDEPPARTSRRSRDTGRTAARSTRSPATGRRSSAASSRSDGQRTRTSAKSSTSTRAPSGGRRSKKEGSADDPPF